MKGLSIKINDAIYNIGLKNGIVDFMITNKEGEYHIHAAGMDENALSYTWYSGELLPGDVFEIEQTDLKEDEVTQHLKTSGPGVSDEDLLHEYHKLRTELLAAGYEI